MTLRERVVRGDIHSEHIVHFFDGVDSLADRVGGFLAEGYRHGEQLVVVARSRNWEAISRRMTNLGCDITSAFASSRLLVLDAHVMLREFMRAGQPDSILFHQTIGGMVSKHAHRPFGLRIYGEMVEVLAEEANFDAAQRLEELWNELTARNSFILMCGYSAAHFAGHDMAALKAICASHTSTHASDADPLAGFLLARAQLPSPI